MITLKLQKGARNIQIRTFELSTIIMRHECAGLLSYHWGRSLLVSSYSHSIDLLIEIVMFFCTQKYLSVWSPQSVCKHLFVW